MEQDVSNENHSIRWKSVYGKSSKEGMDIT